MSIIVHPVTGHLTCELHGGKLSSDCGMFDAPCGVCESEMEDDRAESEWNAKTPEERASTEEWAAVHASRMLHRGTWVPHADDILF
jgi:hypothetical protein